MKIQTTIVIDHGRLVQSDKHEELIHQAGKYRDLVHLSTSQQLNEKRVIIV
ncbi:hypothetical protein [Bacillus sp. 03113]|uniref:hypothetical protein n=1 Tax=Bacillus sp. 03113 TaxID=2578211 RepID=UPI00215CAD65|nr:hypothetical protein [Bacillus sp. 03113]